MTMCRFRGRDDPGYDKVVGELMNLLTALHKDPMPQPVPKVVPDSGKFWTIL
jgi:hypothetical protein